MVVAIKLFKRFSKTGRKLARKEKSFQKAEQKARIADIEAEEAFRLKEDPREQVQLKQSMFGRGLGKSTINTQANERLLDLQARRKAALSRQKDLAHRGLSLIKLRAKAARRMLPLDIADEIGNAAMQVAGAAAGIPIPGGGGTSGLDEAMWSE